MYPYAEVVGGVIGGVFFSAVIVVLLWQKGYIRFQRPPK